MSAGPCGRSTPIGDDSGADSIDHTHTVPARVSRLSRVHAQYVKHISEVESHRLDID